MELQGGREAFFKMTSRVDRCVCAALLSMCAGVVALHLFLGDIDIDEEFYVTVVRLVALGDKPYEDFFYSQTPLLPYIYSLALQPFGGITLIGGRMFSAVLTVGTIWFSMQIARRQGGRLAGVICGWFWLNGFVLLYNLTLFKTYSLVAFLLTFGVWVVQLPIRLRWRCAISLIAISAGTGVRLSLAPVVPLVAVHLMLENRGEWVELVQGYVAGFLGWCVLFLPWMLPDY